MKASEIYDLLSVGTEILQRRIKSHAHDQVILIEQVHKLQSMMTTHMHKIIKHGDFEVSEEIANDTKDVIETIRHAG